MADTKPNFCLDGWHRLRGVSTLYIAKDGISRGNNLLWWIYIDYPKVYSNSWIADTTHVGYIKDIVEFTGIKELNDIDWKDSLFVVRLD